MHAQDDTSRGAYDRQLASARARQQLSVWDDVQLEDCYCEALPAGASLCPPLPSPCALWRQADTVGVHPHPPCGCGSIWHFPHEADCNVVKLRAL
jgi:hypothetical protein